VINRCIPMGSRQLNVNIHKDATHTHECNHRNSVHSTHSDGFLVYLVETTDMQQLRAFTLAVCVVVAVVAAQANHWLQQSRQQG